MTKITKLLLDISSTIHIKIAVLFTNIYTPKSTCVFIIYNIIKVTKNIKKVRYINNA